MLKEMMICPQCRTPITVSDLEQPNRYIRNGLARLRFRCEFCEDMISYEQMATHRDSCEKNQDNFESCEYCSTDYKKIERKIHEEYCVGHLRDQIENLRTEIEQLKDKNAELAKIISNKSKESDSTEFINVTMLKTISQRSNGWGFALKYKRFQNRKHEVSNITRGSPAFNSSLRLKDRV